MRYASIRSLDISNGEDVGISLFVQGCHFHCDECFNKETWPYDAGREFTDKHIEKILYMLSRQYIKRISILGGEPLCDENVLSVRSLINKIVDKFGYKKKIWIYTGYTYEQIMSQKHTDNIEKNRAIDARKLCISLCDVIVDGRFEKDKKDLSLAFRGSSNQRIIDAKQSLLCGTVVPYELK